MIFSDVPDPRLVTIRRGGTLMDADHHLLGVLAADCTEHVLHYFERARPGGERVDFGESERSFRLKPNTDFG